MGEWEHLSGCDSGPEVVSGGFDGGAYYEHHSSSAGTESKQSCERQRGSGLGKRQGGDAQGSAEVLQVLMCSCVL